MLAEDESKYIPQPQKVLYDYVSLDQARCRRALTLLQDLNDRLAQSLGPGAKLTVSIFQDILEIYLLTRFVDRLSLMFVQFYSSSAQVHL